MHPRLAETMTFVEEKRREILQSFDTVEDDRLCRRAGLDGWSVAEILEHLRLVESGVARLITKRVGQAREAGLGEEQSTSSVMPSFDPFAARLESAVLQAPAAVQPRANVEISEALDGLGTSARPFAPPSSRRADSHLPRSSTPTQFWASSISISG
jgi:hypothetical protein